MAKMKKWKCKFQRCLAKKQDILSRLTVAEFQIYFSKKLAIKKLKKKLSNKLVTKKLKKQTSFSDLAMHGWFFSCRRKSENEPLRPRIPSFGVHFSFFILSSVKISATYTHPYLSAKMKIADSSPFPVGNPRVFFLRVDHNQILKNFILNSMVGCYEKNIRISKPPVFNQIIMVLICFCL